MSQDHLRICLASWAPFYAGAEVAAERLACGLEAACHEVLVVLGTDGETLRHMQSAGLRCEFVPLALTDKWHWWRYVEGRRQMVKLLRRFEPDVVHCNDLSTSQMVGQAARRMEAPRVCHHRFPFGGNAIDWLNKFGAERHVFVSRALRNDLCTSSNRLAHAPGAVVYDGLPLPPPTSESNRKAARERLELPRDKVLALFAGQIVQRKGVADLLHAWQLLTPNQRSRAELLIVGDDLQNSGQYRIEMQQLANQLGSPARFCGFQRNLPDWLSATDFAVVPSHVEPLGNATLEAMAHGLPVIGSRVGGIPEMIEHEETGLLISPHNPAQLAIAIGRLIDDSALRGRLGQHARDRCRERFSIAKHTEYMVDQYRLAIESSARCLKA
jgi:glycosyltransferase involved in cell wall biosynthesis